MIGNSYFSLTQHLNLCFCQFGTTENLVNVWFYYFHLIYMGSRLATLYCVYSEQGCLMVALVSLKCRSVSYIQKIELMMIGVEYKRKCRIENKWALQSCQEDAWTCVLDAQRGWWRGDRTVAGILQFKDPFMVERVPEDGSPGGLPHIGWLCHEARDVLCTRANI